MGFLFSFLISGNLLKLMKFIATVLMCIATAASAFAAEPAALGFDGEEAASVGIYIKDLRTKKVVLDVNSQHALTPASIMKCVTTASALSICGADTSFATRVALEGEAAGDTWKGNIVVTASADPTLESDNFRARKGFCDSIANRLQAKGIKRIEGSIRVVEDLKDAGPIVQWEVGDMAWPYGASLFGFNWRDNISRIKPATGECTPEVPGLEICLEKARGNDLVRGVYSNRLMVFTRDPNDRKWEINTTVPDPAAVFSAQLVRTLRARGIEVTDESVNGGGTPKPLYTHRSARFADIMKSLMVRSDNLFAEGILRAVAPGGTRKAAINRERELWATRGINTRYTLIDDGSGLSRANRFSPRFLGEVLEWMASSRMASTYTTFFPRAGRDGTMRGFLAKSKLKGTVALKTGSVRSVQCYAGYKLNAKGEPTHVIVIMVNGFFCPRREVRKACESLLEKTFL